jgi:hypothetical protein
MRARVLQVAFISLVHFSLCQQHALTLAPIRAGPLRGRHGHHSQVPQADVVRQLLESYLSSFQRWLCEWRIAIRFSKNYAMIFARPGLLFIGPRSVTLLWEPIQWVDILLSRVTLDIRLIWSSHIDRFRKRTAQWMGLLGPILNMRSELSIMNGILRIYWDLEQKYFQTKLLKFLLVWDIMNWFKSWRYYPYLLWDIETRDTWTILEQACYEQITALVEFGIIQNVNRTIHEMVTSKIVKCPFLVVLSDKKCELYFFSQCWRHNRLNSFGAKMTAGYASVGPWWWMHLFCG